MEKKYENEFIFKRAHICIISVSKKTRKHITEVITHYGMHNAESRITRKSQRKILENGQPSMVDHPFYYGRKILLFCAYRFHPSLILVLFLFTFTLLFTSLLRLDSPSFKFFLFFLRWLNPWFTLILFPFISPGFYSR